MKILKMKIFQESVCYKKPFAFKVSETYPLPPYSTVIGMCHNLLQVQKGTYIPMNISVQGDYENIFNNYQTLRHYKKDKITTMPRNVHMLYNVNLILHIKSEDIYIDQLYENILHSGVPIILGRNEDLARIDEIKIMEKQITQSDYLLLHNAYIVPSDHKYTDVSGVNYRLNSVYTINSEQLREWEKVNVKYVERGQMILDDVITDEEGDAMFWYRGEE